MPFIFIGWSFIGMNLLATANLRTKILDFRGSDLSIILSSRGAILMSIGSVESTNLSRDALRREIGLVHHPPKRDPKRGIRKNNNLQVGNSTSQDLDIFLCNY